MNRTTLWPRRAVALAAGAALCLGAGAQQAKAPKVQLWMDVSTGGMAGMPEMDGAAGAVMGGMLGGRGGAGASTAYGAARGMTFMPPRVIDIALYNSLKPGQEAQQFVPAGLRMGESLPLVPPRGEPAREREPGEWTEGRQDKPKGRILVYWGCGDTVRKGQPRVIDLARAGASDFGAAFSGRYAADRGARVTPQHALYPNERNRVQPGRDSSLAGEHRIEGPGVPASMKFTLGAAQDLMPQIDLRTRGRLADSIELSWGALPQARAYYIQATGQAGDDLIMWASAETGDTGMGLFDYLPNGTIDRWVKERVLLRPDTTACAIPKGIFNNAQGAAARMIAYGSESNFVHPPRPADAKAPWDPEWAVRVRVKSNTMAMLGEDSAAGHRGGASQATGTPAQEENRNPVQDAVDSVLPVPGLLRGLFGR
jgi:hypothetical protein